MTVDIYPDPRLGKFEFDGEKWMLDGDPLSGTPDATHAEALEFQERYMNIAGKLEPGDTKEIFGTFSGGGYAALSDVGRNIAHNHTLTLENYGEYVGCSGCALAVHKHDLYKLGFVNAKAGYDTARNQLADKLQAAEDENRQLLARIGRMSLDMESLERKTKKR